MGMHLHHSDTIQMDFDAGGLGQLQGHLEEMLSWNNYPNPATEHTGVWHFPVSGK
jgi:hypothetical protein